MSITRALTRAKTIEKTIGSIGRKPICCYSDET